MVDNKRACPLYWWGWWLLLGFLSVLIVPLFLRMPLWADAVLYDMAARNLLDGGVPYRDIFDTNLPGMAWLHALIRILLGWSPEAVRVADLAVVGAGLWLLSTLQPGFAAWRRAGLGCVLLALYANSTENCHVQRDVWMLLPALTALRLRRTQLAAGPTASFRRALAEGALWGAAVWIKPFILAPALASWLVGLARSQPRPGWRACSRDLAGLLVGGVVVGGLGALWLLTRGAWSDFLDVMLHWNPEYYALSPTLEQRLLVVGYVFYPWGLVHLLAVPLALCRLRRGDLSTALLAALYLGWLAQAVLIQKPFPYVLLPPLFLAVTLTANEVARLCSSNWAWSAFVALALALLFCQPFFAAHRLALWGRCFYEVDPTDLQTRLSLADNDNSPNRQELRQVAEHLRGLGLKDGELTCYNNSPVSLYLELGLRPSTRYLHFNTMLLAFPNHLEQLRNALKASSQRYVVSDLRGLGMDEEAAHAQVAGEPLALPSTVPRPNARCFPWSEPIVFRAGRYLVHRVTGPVRPLLPEREAHRD